MEMIILSTAPQGFFATTPTLPVVRMLWHGLACISEVYTKSSVLRTFEFKEQSVVVRTVHEVSDAEPTKRNATASIE